jgi:hypothetical protein
MQYTGDMSKDYITTAEAAKLLGYRGPQRIYELLRVGRLDGIKTPSGAWAVERESVLKFKPKPHGRPRKNT